MKNLAKLAALVVGVLPASGWAQFIEGTVINSDGKAIAGATIMVEGTNTKTTTNKDGKFFIDNLSMGTSELHVSAPGFAHLLKNINVQDDKTTIAIALNRSPIEVIDVVATPIHMSAMESAAPVTVISGEKLRRQQAATLGDSLEKVAGVHSNFHANVASTPVIRGLSGPRVLIAQNGLDVSDVSRVGPDHSVATEASTSKQIEVLRGPATLFYGSGASGGVVNVVDGRVPTDNTTRGEWFVENASVNNQQQAAFNLTTGYESLGFYVDGFWRDADDYDVPEAPELEHPDDEIRSVVNSAEKSTGFTLGTSYIFDQGFIGVAVEQFDREYGIPGHTHGEEDAHAHDDHDHSDQADAAEEQVFADLEQTRIQLLGEWNIEGDYLKQIKFQSGFTDYEHAEIEHGAVGTIFENETSEVKLDLLHAEYYQWKGGVSFHYKNSKVAAQGSEAFTPPSETETLAVAMMEERHFGDWLVQLGARIEKVTIEASDVLLPELDFHSHGDDHDDHGHDDHSHDDHGHDDHGHDAHAGTTRVFAVDHDFTPVSLSAGLVWDFTPGYNVGLSLSRTERAPSAPELLSFGPHIGTRTYEVGALFAVDSDHNDIGLTNETIDLETANNIDLTLRKTEGNVGFILNAFYNEIDNYYYRANTNLFAEAAHDHGGDDGHDHSEHVDELPIYIYTAEDVILSGFEAQLAWQITDEFKITTFSDYVKARLKDGGDLPRTPPLRVGSEFSYENEMISAHLDITRYQRQDNVADLETETAGYTLVDAFISWDLPLNNQDISVYLKGSNLTDTDARVHTSFLKNIAPRPGRNIVIGVRGQF